MLNNKVAIHIDHQLGKGSPSGFRLDSYGTQCCRIGHYLVFGKPDLAACCRNPHSHIHDI